MHLPGFSIRLLASSSFGQLDLPGFSIRIDILDTSYTLENFVETESHFLDFTKLQLAWFLQ